VDTTIALVVTALLLAGLVKGHELITAGKAKRLAADIRAYRLAHRTYIARYAALPGDDVGPTQRWPGMKHGNGDWKLGGEYNEKAPADPSMLNVTATSGEAVIYWWHLRSAQLVRWSEESLLSQPTHAFGGHVGVQQGAFGMSRPVVCFDGIPAEAAAFADRDTDDGIPATGTVRAGRGVDTAPAASYVGASPMLILCARLGRS